jgi:hypothetical protein
MTKETEPKTRQELLKILVKEHLHWEAVIGKLSEDQYLEAGIDGRFSVKDLLAHIVDWEQRMLQWINETLAGIVPQRPAPGMTWDDLDRLNEQTFLANKDRDLDEIMAASDESYSRSLDLIQNLTDEDLFDGSRFAWREGDPLWHMVAANTWWHYREHRLQVENWLKDSD